MFAGSNGASIWRRLLAESIGIKKISTEIPSEYSLSQNYPNPFNPSTTIKYEIPRSGLVNINVFDVLGREVATLVNEKQNPGTYEVKWDATNYPSGVYFYKLISGYSSETKKLVLVK